MTGVELILEYLKAEGVTAIFGIPGGAITPLFDALYHEKNIKTIATRHEAGAAFMAAGYARVSGRLGVCCATTGPGSTNLTTGLAAAAADSLPVMALTAQVATNLFGKGSLQDSTLGRMHTVDLLRPLVKSSFMVASEHNIAFALKQAIRNAMAGRKGPVHLNIPTDLMRKPVAPGIEPPSHYKTSERVFDREAVKEACLYLLQAKQPAILAGHGVNLAGANNELKELAELLGVPVATTPKGKGAFPETHPLALRVFGLAGAPLAERYLLESEVDVLLVLGSSLHEISTNTWDARLNPKQALIQQDIDPTTIGRNYPVTVGLVGELKTTLREMLFQTKRLLNSGEYQKRDSMVQFLNWKKEQDLWLKTLSYDSNSQPIKPQRLMRELAACLPADALIFLDVGNHTLWSLHYLTATGKNAFIHNWGEFAGMGYGVAGAIGGKLAAPKRPVVAIVGDGGFGMMGMEILTAATYNIPVLWIVFNDGRYNTVYHGQKMQYGGRTIGSEFKRMDIAAIAKGLGARTGRIEKPEEIAKITANLLQLNEPAVIDVAIDADEAPPMKSRVEALERAFSGSL